MTDFDPDATYNEVVFSEKWKEPIADQVALEQKDWDWFPRNKVTRNFPLTLDIETTTQCNLACPMCPRTTMMQAGTFGNADGYMSRDEYRKIIDQGVFNNVRSIKLNYLGEPLLHPDVYWHVQYAKDRSIENVRMNTNGTALNAKNSERLMRAGIDGVFISVDAVNPALYEKQRVGAQLGRVVDNIYELSKIRDRFRPQCQLRVSMVMYDDDIWREQFHGLIAMFRGVVDAVGWGWYNDHTDVASEEYQRVEGFHCAQLWQRMFLKQNGNVTICCVDSADEVIVGNWHDESLQQIWRGATYTDLRRVHEEGRYDAIPMCRRCYLPCAARDVVPLGVELP